MIRLLSAAAASLAIATATSAQAGSPYAGIEAGLLSGRSNDVDQFADFTTSQTPTSPAGPASPDDREFDDVFIVSLRRLRSTAGLLVAVRSLDAGDCQPGPATCEGNDQ